MSKRSGRPAVPSNTRPAIAFGLAVILLGVGSFGAWAAIANLSSAIIAGGTTKVLGHRKKVQSQDGGVVRELAVQNGQLVKKGDILVKLDDTKARAAVEIAQGSYDLLRATVARLRSERDDLADISFPEDLLSRTHIAMVADIVEGQRHLLDARRQALAGQLDMTRERISQLEEQIVGLRAQSAAKDRQIRLIAQETADLRNLLEQGLTPRSRVAAMEREAARLEGEKGEHDAGIARAQAQIAEARLQILQQRIAYREKASDELGTKEADMFALAEQLSDARHTLEQTIIRATEDGVVVELEVHTIGGVVQAGATLMEIVPVGDNLVVEAQIRPVDIDNVTIGLHAEMIFPGLPKRKTPKFSGQVSYVSADALTDPKTGLAYYAAHVSLPPDQKTLAEQIIPGMPVEVFIKTGERTPLAYLMQPLQDSFSKAWREQ